MAFGTFRQDRYFPRLFQPGSDAVSAGPGLYTTQALVESEPGLYAFTVVPFALGYVSLTPYNAEAT